jgi:hypothetical protein
VAQLIALETNPLARTLDHPDPARPENLMIKSQRLPAHIPARASLKNSTVQVRESAVLDTHLAQLIIISGVKESRVHRVQVDIFRDA